MTRRDYIAIAGAIMGARVEEGAPAGAALDVVAENIADVLAQDNDQFDRERFLNAAGVV